MRRVACLLVLVAACGEPAVMPHPQEVPIAEFSAAPIGTGSEPPVSSGTLEVSRSEPKGGEAKLGEGHPEGKGDAKKGEGGGIDGMDGAFGARFGTDAKACGKTKSVEKSGERQVLQSLERRKDLGAVASPVFTLVREKVGTIGFRVKTPKECKGVKSSLEKRLGGATASAKGKGGQEALVWKGDATGLRLAIDGKGCSGLVVSKEFGRPEDWAALEP